MDKNYAFDAFTREALEAWTIAIQRVCAVLLKVNIAKNGVVTDTSESVRPYSAVHRLSQLYATSSLTTGVNIIGRLVVGLEVVPHGLAQDTQGGLQHGVRGL